MNIKNKKGYFNFQVLEEFNAGMILKGSEAKSISQGKINFGDAFIYFMNGELFLKNFHIDKYKNASYTNHEELRERKILLTKSEVSKISKLVETNNGITIIPLEIFSLNGKFKVKIGVVKGKKDYDKRESIKRKDVEREMKRNDD